VKSGAGPGSEADHVEIGVVARAHGIRGELRVHLHNPGSTALDRAAAVQVGGRSHAVEAARPVSGAYLLKLAGVPDRTAAEGLRGQPVAVPRQDLDLEEGEVLLADLIGCRAELPDGSDWGVISRVEPGPQDRIVIEQGEVERLLPVAGPFLLESNLTGRRVVVDPPEGLPEDPARRR
jgi:16S rRNA processing protein RimM